MNDARKIKYSVYTVFYSWFFKNINVKFVCFPLDCTDCKSFQQRVQYNVLCTILDGWHRLHTHSLYRQRRWNNPWQNQKIICPIPFPGFDVIVLSMASPEWYIHVPWWTWMILGMVFLMLLICLALKVLKSVGVTSVDRPVRYSRWVFILSVICCFTYLTFGSWPSCPARFSPSRTTPHSPTVPPIPPVPPVPPCPALSSPVPPYPAPSGRVWPRPALSGPIQPPSSYKA